MTNQQHFCKCPKDNYKTCRHSQRLHLWCLWLFRSIKLWRMKVTSLERSPTQLCLSNLQIANLTGIGHRNLIRFFGIVRYDDRWCPVLEYATRGSVESILDNGDMSLLRASRLTWLRDCARGRTWAAAVEINFWTGVLFLQGWTIFTPMRPSRLSMGTLRAVI